MLATVLLSWKWGIDCLELSFFAIPPTRKQNPRKQSNSLNNETCPYVPVWANNIKEIVHMLAASGLLESEINIDS